MSCATKLILLGTGSSGLTLAHLPELRRYVRRFVACPGARLMHGAGGTRKEDGPAAIGADKLWETACALEWPWFRVADVERWPADWKTLGGKAGPRRNEQMHRALRGYVRRGWTVRWAAAHTDPGLGKGTAHMVRLCSAERWKGRVLLMDADGALRPEEATP
ncbi:hypothetical protein [Myxococcus sp. CA040A]|uniref:hypothetical protein n=1 Tax=Myxococcus sp. CA040A TaxID=2741738 RepID=UPI00157B0E8E|nr:hypothetical protein [Myxococcus sp. CA040A]NTX08290.1 hypothetical protein [Myxococcus sp. CA040A]